MEARLTPEELQANRQLFEDKLLGISRPTNGWGWCRDLTECAVAGYRAEFSDDEITLKIAAAIPHGGRRAITLMEIARTVAVGKAIWVSQRNSPPVKVDDPFALVPINNEVTYGS